MNDLKTLYDACSDKDELAQIAEKLGIERGGLPQILNELIDAIPEGGAEPFIVEGCHSYQEEGTTFIKAPASSESAAITAFKEGRVVLFHVIYSEDMSEDVDDYFAGTSLVSATINSDYGNIMFNL